jgi:predicted aldo/keto reductase-like oxidoreductase
MSYGISNSHGILSNKEIKNILSLAHRANIHYIDTAISYGSAEDRLGQFDLSKFNVITKIPKITNLDLMLKNGRKLKFYHHLADCL